MTTHEYFPQPGDDTQPGLTVPVFNTPYDPSPVPPPPPPILPPPASRRGGRIAAIAATVLVLLGIGAGLLYAAWHGGALPFGNATPGALTAARDYCAAVQARNYARAYTYFAPALQSAIPASVYPQLAGDLDAQQGAITACTAGSANASGSSATVAATVKRQNSAAQQLTWTLGLSNGVWRFSQSPEPSLPARATAAAYCTDLTGANYSAAFTLFAPVVQQQLVAIADYTAAATDIDTALGRATACATTGVDVAADGSATAHLHVMRKQAETDDVAVAAPANNAALFAAAPDVSLPSRVTAYLFCQDLKAKDYNSAFNLLTPSAQQNVGSPDTLKQRIESAETLTGQISACHSQTFTLNSDQHSGTLTGQLTTSALLGPLNLPVTLKMAEVTAGKWLIDDYQIAGLPLS
jgi:hypothetical protein